MADARAAATHAAGPSARLQHARSHHGVMRRLLFARQRVLLRQVTVHHVPYDVLIIFNSLSLHGYERHFMAIFLHLGLDLDFRDPKFILVIYNN